MKLGEIHKRTNTELIDLVGAKRAGWALAVIEINRRGINVEYDSNTKMTRSEVPNSPRKTLRFWLKRLFKGQM